MKCNNLSNRSSPVGPIRYIEAPITGVMLWKAESSAWHFQDMVFLSYGVLSEEPSHVLSGSSTPSDTHPALQCKRFQIHAQQIVGDTLVMILSNRRQGPWTERISAASPANTWGKYTHRGLKKKRPEF